MAKPWWDAQSEPVRAILDLANDADDGAVARILRTFDAGQHADAVQSIGRDLVWIERLRADHPHEVLSAYYDKQWHGWDGDLLAETEAAELQAEVLARAQLIAALIERWAAA